MLRGLLMTMTICLTGAMCAPTQAAQVVFAGTITQAGKSAGLYTYGNGVAASLNVGFVPGGVTAGATNATFKVGNTVFNVDVLSTDVTVNSGGTYETVTVNLGSAINGNQTLNNLFPSSFTWTSTVPTSLNLGQNDTLNWQAIYNAAANPKNIVNGGFALRDTTGGNALNQSYTFSGAAVPEPGSIALLSGLGLVFGAVRRRRQTRATAV